MIKKISNENEIFNFECDDIYALRIKSLLFAYGTGYDFATFYCCYNSDETAVAIISKLDNDFTVCCNNLFDVDYEEISQFITVLGYDSVLTDDNFKFYNNENYETGAVMVTEKKVEFPLQFGVIDEYPKLMDLYNLENFDNCHFEAWYVDLSHRIRHSSAKAYALKIKDEIVSSGIFSSIYNNNAILTSVQTEPEFRKMGYASSLVSHMICDINGKVYLMREKDRNENFYKKLGFVNCGIWRMYK